MLGIKKQILDLLSRTHSKWKQRNIQKNSEFVAYLDNVYPAIPLIQQIYLLENALQEVPRCMICGVNTPIFRYCDGYSATCSKKCCDLLKRSPRVWQSQIEKRKQTTIDRYGVENVFELDSIKDKIKQTMLDRYGVEHNSHSPASQQRKLSTNLNRYGVPYPAQNQQVRNKSNMTRCGAKAADNLARISEDREFLISLLNTMTAIEVGDKLGLSDRTICAYANKHGISDGYRSNGEHSLGEWLAGLGLPFRRNDRTLIKPREIDFLFSEQKVGIEFDGLSRHCEIYGQKAPSYHLEKTESCAKHGVQLIHLFEDEWYDKREIVQSIIKTRLGLQSRGVGARLLSIDYIDTQTARTFFDRYHIQGGTRFQHCLGAHHDHKLVAVMGFGSPTRQSSHPVELTRFCTNGPIYPGIGSRLLRKYLLDQQPSSVVSFCDRRFFTGQSYTAMGFVKEKILRPDYYYTEKHRFRHHKSKFRISRLKQKYGNIFGDRTEWEIMQLLKYDRIFDCGKIRFSYLLGK